MKRRPFLPGVSPATRAILFMLAASLGYVLWLALLVRTGLIESDTPRFLRVFELAMASARGDELPAVFVTIARISLTFMAASITKLPEIIWQNIHYRFSGFQH